MRKKLILAAALCVLLCALTACGGTRNEKTASPEAGTPPQTQTEPPEAPEAYEPSDIQPVEPAIPEETPEPVKTEEPAIPQTDWSGMLTAYRQLLEELYQAYDDPERFRYEDGPSFAVYDVDRDGTEELLIQDPVSELVQIYGYSSAGKVYLELEEYSNLYCYDNGVIEVGWSHNQGAAGDKLWPYNVYQYNPGTGVYDRIAAVDGWDKALREIFSGKAFPAEADLDGDGFIYYVITEPGGYAPDYGEAMDYAAYEDWRQSYLQGAEPSGVPLLPLIRENIEQLA